MVLPLVLSRRDTARHEACSAYCHAMNGSLSAEGPKRTLAAVAVFDRRERSDPATTEAPPRSGERHPDTPKHAMDAPRIPGVLAVTATAGLYEDSGKRLNHMGLRPQGTIDGGISPVFPHPFDIAVPRAARRRGQRHPRATGLCSDLERARRQLIRGRSTARA